MENYDVVILGGGPAGLSTAIYTLRSNLKTLIIDTGIIGGKLNMYEHIENYPGFTEKDTYKLAGDLVYQVTDLGASFRECADIQIVNLETKIIKVDNETIHAKNIVIATGSKPRKLNIEGEEEFIGKGVSYCATCDGPFFKDKVIAVIGGGNTAIEEALYLTKFAKKVYIIHRRDNFRADNVTVEEAKTNSKIEFVLNRTPKSILGTSKVEQIDLIDTITMDEVSLKVDGVFPFIGIIPNSSMFGQLQWNNGMFIKTDECMRTSMKGVYAVGDVRSTPFRQVITACADGAIAGHFISKE